MAVGRGRSEGGHAVPFQSSSVQNDSSRGQTPNRERWREPRCKNLKSESLSQLSI